MQEVTLLAAGTSVVMEAYKWLVGRYGVEATRRSIYLGVFALSLLWTVLQQTNLVSLEAAQQFGQMVLVSIGTYELIIKNVKALMFPKV